MVTARKSAFALSFIRPAIVRLCRPRPLVAAALVLTAKQVASGEAVTRPGSLVMWPRANAACRREGRDIKVAGLCAKLVLLAFFTTRLDTQLVGLLACFFALDCSFQGFFASKMVQQATQDSTLCVHTSAHQDCVLLRYVVAEGWCVCHESGRGPDT